MLVTRKSIVSDKERTLDLPITDEQIARYKSGALVQDAFPNLDADQREFILTGITADEWDETFADEGEDLPEDEDEAAF